MEMKGDLKRSMQKLLADNPNDEFTVSEICRLVKSEMRGAVQEHLKNMTDSGYAVQVRTVRPSTWKLAPKLVAKTPALPPRPGTTAPPAPTLPPGEKIVTIDSLLGKLDNLPGTPVPASREEEIRTVTRPNGQVYLMRKIAGKADIDVMHSLREADIPVMLYGPPGTGKTALVEAAFLDDLITITGDGDTTVADFIGTWTIKEDGGYRWIDGPLVRAMKEGKPLLIDDATVIPAKVMAVLYPAMDGRKRIVVKEHEGEIVEADSGFYPVAAHNPGTHGAVLSDALSSRFAVQIQVGTDYDLAKILKIHEEAINLATHLNSRFESGDLTWAPQLRELIAFKRFADVMGFDAALANMIGTAPEEVRDEVVEAVESQLARRKVKALRIEGRA